MVAWQHARELGADLWPKDVDMASYVSLYFFFKSLRLTDVETSAVPIGTAADKGVDFPRNPRFSADGAWLPRKQWPPELR